MFMIDAIYVYSAIDDDDVDDDDDDGDVYI